MSNEAVNQFLERVQSDEQLQEELAQVIESAEDAGEGADREGATDLGKKYGYDFTSAELWAEIKKRQDEFQQRQTSGELSDEELEAVAGGGEIWITTAFTATTAIATALIPKIKW
jgi:predicted ribosomally synthesized peptide with nif11-like leader